MASPIKKVLITGATGRIGVDLAPRMSEAFEVYSGVRREVKDLPNPTPCLIGDFDSVKAACKGMDAVIHLAGQSWDADIYEKMIPDNITGCYNVFEAALQTGVKRVIFASTNHTVGNYLEEGRTIDEDAPVRPDTFYGVTKVYGEALGRFYAERKGLSVISARIGWHLAEDDPNLARNRRSWDMWLSFRDCGQFMTKALQAENIRYECLHCISGKTRRLMLIERARNVIGYEPEDDSERLIKKHGWDEQPVQEHVVP